MLRRYTWEKAREKLQHYRRRNPEASPLYQIVYHSRDDLQFQWEARFQHQYGCLRDEVLKTLDEYLNCGILAHGALVSGTPRLWYTVDSPRLWYLVSGTQ